MKEFCPLVICLLTRIAEALEQGATAERRLSAVENRADADYLSIKDAAALTGLSSTTIRRAIKSSTLPASDLGTLAHSHYRIARSDLTAWMEKNRGGNNVPPQPQRIKRKVKSRYFDEM